MHCPQFERRKYPRFNAEIPVDIGLINLKSGKRAQVQFKGITKDISMEGLGLELDYPGSNIISFAPTLVGANKEFDFDLDVNLGRKHVRGVGEVRWARIHSPSILRMGIFLKAIGKNEKEKWANFVMRQRKAFFQDLSWQEKHSGHKLIKWPVKIIRDLISTNLSINYILPVMFVCSSVVVYWFVELRCYHVVIFCGVISIILLIGYRSFSKRYRKSKG